MREGKERPLQKGGVPAAPSGTATLLRLSPNHQFRPRPILAVTDFRRPRLSWLDGRCVQGPGTYSPRHGEFEFNGKTVSLRKVEYNKNNPLPLSYGRGNGFKPNVARGDDWRELDLRLICR